MTTRRKVLLGIAALLVLLLVLRELGVVDMSLYTSSAEWRFTSTYGDGERPEDPGGGFAYTTRTDPARRTVQLEGSTGSGPVDSIGRLTRFDVEGLTWVPLHKTGRATFAAEITATKGWLAGAVEGEISLTVTGPCSARQFRGLLLETALESVEDSMKDQLD